MINNFNFLKNFIDIFLYNEKFSTISYLSVNRSAVRLRNRAPYLISDQSERWRVRYGSSGCRRFRALRLLCCNLHCVVCVGGRRRRRRKLEVIAPLTPAFSLSDNLHRYWRTVISGIERSCWSMSKSRWDLVTLPSFLSHSLLLFDFLCLIDFTEGTYCLMNCTILCVWWLFTDLESNFMLNDHTILSDSLWDGWISWNRY